ncbi:hypothetical protein EDD11_003993 [Mortierella claussenii]|nr:hypothetical protein EDD11_003993 [Mortierella claussenii]
MLPRLRPWEPKLVQADKGYRDSYHMQAAIRQSMLYIGSELHGDDINESVLYDVMAESERQDYELSYYDPFMGNLCASGRFLDLPVIITPGGSSGADVSITLVSRKPQLQPPYRFIAPKTSLISFHSAICQLATPSRTSRLAAPEEQFLVRTRESVTILAPAHDVPEEISRVEPGYIQVVAHMPAKPPSCKDRTIHAAISPYASNTYALMGDQGRIAIWTRPLSNGVHDPHRGHGMDYEDDTYVEPYGPQDILSPSQGQSSITVVKGEEITEPASDDPWRSCTWAAHPSQLVTSSRKTMDLVDFRTCLFMPRKGETIRAIQDDGALQLAPFQTYVATSHQIACIDHRYAKKPLISWAHQMHRAMPCGIKAMDLVSEGANYTTVLTWSQRNADIMAYNVSLGSTECEPEPMIMKGRAQELPSFHAHSQYTNSYSLRDPLGRADFISREDGLLQQAIKPPLLGLAVIPNTEFGYQDQASPGDALTTAEDVSVAKFSLAQYAFTGAVYAQEIELHTQQEVNAKDSPVPRDSILSEESVSHRLDAASANELTSTVAYDTEQQQLHEEQIIDSIIKATQGNVAPWKVSDWEAQALADEVTVSRTEVRAHIDLDLRSLLSKLETYVSMDRDAPVNIESVDIDAKVFQVMEIISNTASPRTMYDLLQEVNCINATSSERRAIVQRILQNIELDPYDTSHGGEIIRRQVRKTWPNFGLEVDALIQDAEPSEEAIVAFLEDLYPLPESVALEPNQDRKDENALTNQLANLSIPVSECGPENMDASSQDDFDIWPTEESRLIRSRTIRRLAQDLLISTIIVIQTFEPEISGAQKVTDTPTFQHLFRGAKSGVSVAPIIQLSSQCKPILAEWKVGEDPNNYVYRLPEGIVNDFAGSGEEMDPEEAKENEERLLRMRQKREKRAEKHRLARLNDPGYNVNAASSASLPAGVIPDASAYSSMAEADEDGMFSMPTVVAASQPSLLLRARSLARSQPLQQISKPKPSLKSMPVLRTKPTMAASQPAMPASLLALEASSAARRDIVSENQERGFPLSQDRAMFQPISFANSDSWQRNLPGIRTADSSSELDKSETESKSHARDGGYLWGATQPVESTTSATTFMHGGLSQPIQGHASLDAGWTTWGPSQPLQGLSVTKNPAGAFQGVKARLKARPGDKAKPKKARIGGF